VGSSASMRPASSLRTVATAEPVAALPSMSAEEVASAVQMLRMMRATQSVGALVGPGAGVPSDPPAALDDGAAQRSLALLALAQGPQLDTGACRGRGPGAGGKVWGCVHRCLVASLCNAQGSPCGAVGGRT
jgi:hypothetical protein